MVKNQPADGSVQMRDVTLDRGVLVVAGPRSRELLQKLTDADLANGALPWLSAQEIMVGVAPVRALRVNFVGELGWELRHPLAHQLHLWDSIMEAGREFDIRPFGMRAMDSLRVEKSYRYWRVDLSTEYSPLESGMGRFVQLNKGEFVGREALLRYKAEILPESPWDPENAG